MDKSEETWFWTKIKQQFWELPVTDDDHPIIKLDPKNVPSELHPFIPYAEKWGNQDIDIREHLVEKASLKELYELASIWEFCVGSISNWLNQSQVRAEPTTNEYIAFTCLILAVSSARHRLAHLDKELIETFHLPIDDGD